MIIVFSRDEYPSLQTSAETVNTENYGAWWMDTVQDSTHPHQIVFAKLQQESNFYVRFANQTDAEKALRFLNNTATKKGQNIMNNITDDLKGFVKENRSTIYWMAIIFLVDHLFLDGALRHKLKDTVDSLLTRINKSIDKNEQITK